MSTREDGRGVGGDADEPVGNLSEETLKLLVTLADWARQQGATLADGPWPDDHRSCRYCPWCRAVDLVREVSPEVHEHLAEAAGSLAKAGLGVVTAVAARASGERVDGGVEHIVLDEEGEWPAEEWPDEEWPDERLVAEPLLGESRPGERPEEET